MLKTCQKCKQEKAPSEFFRCKSKHDGLQTRCKDCQRVETRERMRKPHNAAKQLERTRAWQEENREKFNAYKSAWAMRDYHANKGKWRVWQTKYAKKIAEELTPGYVAGLIAKAAGCRRDDVPPEMVGAKRAYLQTKRLITEKAK